MLRIRGQLKKRWKKTFGFWNEVLPKFAEHSMESESQQWQHQTTLNKQKTIISTIRHKKLTLFGHICRMPDNRQLKSELFGSMEGVRYRGRQPKWWLDNITEWTGLSIGDAVKMTQDRDVWRSFVCGLSGPWPWDMMMMMMTIDYSVFHFHSSSLTDDRSSAMHIDGVN